MFCESPSRISHRFTGRLLGIHRNHRHVTRQIPAGFARLKKREIDLLDGSHHGLGLKRRAVQPLFQNHPKPRIQRLGFHPPELFAFHITNTHLHTSYMVIMTKIAEVTYVKNDGTT